MITNSQQLVIRSSDCMQHAPPAVRPIESHASGSHLLWALTLHEYWLVSSIRTLWMMRAGGCDERLKKMRSRHESVTKWIPRAKGGLLSLVHDGDDCVDRGIR